MHIRNLTNRAYILWLIRQSGTVTWRALAERLEMNPSERFTAFGIVVESLGSLMKAGLIHASHPVESLLSDSAVDSITFSVTPLVSDVQQALQISLTDLAAVDMSNRLIVAPTLNRTFSSRFQSEILVLMPFISALSPVYDDHLKAVARQLEMSIARADDFFTSGYVVEEIWTAILLARVIVADCTGRNPNVFYEIGLAHAVGKPVVLIAQDEDDVPFDLRHRRYLRYQFTPRGMKEFETTVAKVIAETRAELETSHIPESRS